jgi:hypothetical protein
LCKIAVALSPGPFTIFASGEIAMPQRFGLDRLLVCLIVLASVAWGQNNATAKHVVVRAARMLDVKAGKIVPNAVVVIEGERILAVGAGFVVPQAEVIDLGDATLMPGLIDCHPPDGSNGTFGRSEQLCDQSADEVAGLPRA